ncbi:MAG TPA: hypothetical protein VM618_09560 [Acidimicrobiia bacterium]|nr:hypothetical protein [Acidimicrobiia bacterium]
MSGWWWLPIGMLIAGVPVLLVVLARTRQAMAETAASALLLAEDLRDGAAALRSESEALGTTFRTLRRRFDR